ncbi:glycosyltransferase family 4 protein [Cobetia amphilecti]|uniref:Glycosyltransferase family 4 protein n=1 Tax=Cobetia amphilecti TaxID=1055104 RepID=A0AAP4WX68_9GAMM|nr:glycosyltransferase family 4 protein [Cobetia amphilecti]MDO6670839.1 glycosyltransferase family 4 protein [Cobetia amphilecti]
MKKYNRICFISNSAWYLNNFRESTLHRFKKEYSVACLIPHEDVTSFNSLDGTSLGRYYLDPTSKNVVKEFLTLCSIFLRLVFSRPDIVFSFNPKTNLYSLIACWILRIPCVPNVSGVGQASQLDGLTGKIYNKLVAFFYKRATHVYFQNSQDHQSFIAKEFVTHSYSEVLPGSGVDLKKFTPVNINGVRSFLMAARLIYPKGVMQFINASKNILDSKMLGRFYLAGVKEYTARSIPEINIVSFNEYHNAEYLGQVTNMPEVLNRIHCMVLPSYYPEGTPRSLLEAAAAGKVIITTDTPGCRDVVIEGVNGFLVPPRDTEALEEAIEKVINLSDEKLAEMQANSRKLAEEKFDEQYVIQRYLDVAEEILAKKSK